MKILITGGAGFIGSAVVRLAISRGISVVNVDALKYSACLENLVSISTHRNYMFEKVDITDRLALSRVFSIHQPDSVMHLAAETHVDRSIDSPVDFVETNILGTYNILEASRTYWYANNRPKNFRFHQLPPEASANIFPLDYLFFFPQTLYFRSLVKLYLHQF